MRTKNLDDASTWIGQTVATAGARSFRLDLLAAVVFVIAVGLAATPALSQAVGQALAQSGPQDNHPLKSDPLKPAPQQPASQKAEPKGFLESLAKWLSDQADSLNATFKDAGKKVENFGQQAGVAAKTTVEGAKDAADAVARMSTARVVAGHEKCRVAPNGAPDCVAAATAMCKAKGFASGQSADMTTAEVCPPSVYIAGRNSGPECRTETFVSRALCQ